MYAGVICTQVNHTVSLFPSEGQGKVCVYAYDK